MLKRREMAERIVSMHAAHRSGKDVVDGFLSRPIAGGERPAVVLVHGYRGLDDGQRAVTRRFAQEGFVCLSPDLFHGKTYHTLEDCALKKNLARYSARRELYRRQCAVSAQTALGRQEKSGGLRFLHGRRFGALRVGAVQSLRCRGDLLSKHVSRSGGSEEHYRADAVPLRHRRSRHDSDLKSTCFARAWTDIKRNIKSKCMPAPVTLFSNNPSSKNAANRDAADKSVASTTKWLKKLWRN